MDSDLPGPSNSAGGLPVVHTGRIHILVIAASKHGSTYEIAEVVVHRLEGAGHSVDIMTPAAMESVDPCDVIVCGSAVYILQWMNEAKSFLERFAERLETKRVWAFSVGMNRVPKHAPQDPTRIGPALTHVLVVDKHTFVGRYKPSLLSLRERLVVRFTGTVEGDFHDQSEAETWAGSIAAKLSDKD